MERFHQEWHGREGELRITPDLTNPVSRATLLERTLVQSTEAGTNWFCGPKEFKRLLALASPQEQRGISARFDEWEGGEPVILLPYWGPEDRLTFSVVQYTNLDEEQIRTKLSQMPSGTKLYFQTYTAEQMSSPVSMGKQQAVLQGLRKYAAGFGVTIEERPRAS